MTRAAKPEADEGAPEISERAAKIPAPFEASQARRPPI